MDRVKDGGVLAGVSAQGAWFYLAAAQEYVTEENIRELSLASVRPTESNGGWYLAGIGGRECLPPNPVGLNHRGWERRALERRSNLNPGSPKPPHHCRLGSTLQNLFINKTRSA